MASVQSVLMDSLSLIIDESLTIAMEDEGIEDGILGSNYIQTNNGSEWRTVCSGLFSVRISENLRMLTIVDEHTSTNRVLRTISIPDFSTQDTVNIHKWFVKKYNFISNMIMELYHNRHATQSTIDKVIAKVIKEQSHNYFL